jgi:hypothetical protein
MKPGTTPADLHRDLDATAGLADILDRTSG